MRYLENNIHSGSHRWYVCNKIIKGLNNSVSNNSYVRNELYCCNTTNIIIIINKCMKYCVNIIYCGSHIV